VANVVTTLSVPDFSTDADSAAGIQLQVTWSATNNGSSLATGYVYFWLRKAGQTTFQCVASTAMPSVTLGANGGSTGLVTEKVTIPAALSAVEGDKIELAVTVDTATNCGVPPSQPSAAQDSTTLDLTPPIGYAATGPRDPATAGNTAALFCNTSELFAVARDNPGGSATNWAGMKDIVFSGTGVSIASLMDALATQGPVFTTTVRKLSLPTGGASASVDAQAVDFANNQTTPTSLVTRTYTSSDPDAQPCKSFTDVSGTEWFAVYVRYLGSAGLISGFPDGSYRPNDPVTRAQLAKLLVASLGFTSADLPTSAPSGCAFNDVASGAWYAGWVWKACQLGIMIGVGGGNFAPDAPVTRGQAATAIWRLRTQSDKSSGTGFVDESVIKGEAGLNRTLRGNPPFMDVLLAAFYADAVKFLYNIGVVDGTSATTFSPDDPVTRAQIAKMLYRALGRWFPL
jgi:hypothetical protein